MGSFHNESHIKNLIMMAQSDDHVDQSEIDIICSIAKNRGISEEKVKELIASGDTDFEISKPDTIDECFEQLYDLALVMMADGIIDDDEMDFCTDFAEQLGLAPKEANFIVLSIVEGLENQFSKSTIHQASERFLAHIDLGLTDEELES
ncbi:MAG: TerB family tellurite resistance protein [Cytophagales bacterium]|nr:TerB family tellurite resistance protein [Cytophagales bacterium]